MSDLAAHLGEPLRSEHDERNDGDDEDLEGAELGHQALPL